MALLFIMLQSALDIWHAERDFCSTAESQSSLVDGDGEPDPDILPTARPHRLLLISSILCTLTLIFSIDISFTALASLIAFLITAPLHIALYFVSLRPQSPNPLLAYRYNAFYAFFLVALWCWVFVLNVLVAHGLWRRIVTGILSGLEGLVVIVLATLAGSERFSHGAINL